MWNVSSNPQKFESAIAWFRARVPMTREEWNRLSLRNRRKAFTIGGVAQMDIVNDVYSEIANALENGEHLEDFQKRITEKLMTVWDSKKKASARAQTIIRNAHQSAYSAGRYEQMTKPAVTKARPYWMFDGVLDRRQGEICRERNDIIRRFDDPWWRMNYPPLHHRCRSGVRTLTARQALERGIKELPKLPKPTRGFGLIPTENEWQPDPKDYQPALFKVWTKKLEGLENSSTPSVPAPAAGPLGTPVSAALRLEVSAKSEVGKAVRSALATIDEVHGDGALPEIPVVKNRRKSSLGMYTHQLYTDEAVEISLSSNGTHKELTFAHEVGHFLDHHGIGRPGVWVSGGRSGSADPILQPWWDAVQKSSSYQSLLDLRNQKTVEIDGIRYWIDRSSLKYYLQPNEVWARAYAQYIATRGKSDVMKQQLNAIIGSKSPYKVRHWTEDDFEPIAKTMDELFRSLGWMQ